VLSVEKRNHELVVRFSGDIDHNAAVQMRRKLDGMLDDAQIRRLVFDMRDVEFMDSSGIGMLIGRYKIMRSKGGSVAVTGMDQRINKIFEMAGLYRIIEKLA